ncbi:MAG: amidohydrolase [Gemmatimonadales bacterium]
MSRLIAPVALLLLLPPALLQAQSDADIAAATARIAPKMVEIRHDIHRNPELGNHETRTAGIIAAELTRLGLEVRTGVAHTGVIGILRGGKPGPVVAIRADMDALPVTELTDVPFKSVLTTTYLGREVGVSHACGHDTHVAAQLGVANLLAGMKAKLTGTVVFLFQPAEEGLPAGESGGAKLMVAEGALTNPRPDLILAFHADGDPPEGGHDMELGRVSYTPGPAMASATRFTAKVIGRQAHGSTPHLGIDAIVTSSQIVLALQTIRSRSMSPFTPSVVTVGVMRGGDRNNIVAGEMLLEGTIRTFSAAAQDSIEQRMREIFDGLTRSAGATFTLEFDRSHPVTVNDTLLAARFDPVLRRVIGSDKVDVRPPITGAEDFSYFAQQVPGFYIFVGAVPPGKVSGGHHTPTFYADDGTVPVAMRVMTALVLEGLGSRGR